MKQSWLYRAEAKGIQSWILASDRLRELKGGSALVDALPELARSLVHRTGGDVVIAAAGGIEVRFHEQASLERFAGVWPAVVENHAPGLELVQAWVADSGLDPYPELHRRLGAARNRRWPALPAPGPLSARSARTGLAAESRDEHDRALLDAATRAKVRAAAGVGQLDRLAPVGLSFATETAMIGDTYVAVVHADGNAVGSRIRTLGPDQRRQFSDALSEATRRAAQTAVRELARIQQLDDDATVLRCRPIVVGGDDLTFLVDAVLALPFTEAYLRAFEAETVAVGNVDGKGPLTACAGLAFVKTGFPFHAAHELAESLCGGAKSALRAGNRSGLLFHRVTTSSPDTDWESLRAGELAAVGGRSLAGGPYDLERLDRLRALATALRQLPRKAMREWLGLVRVDAGRAQARWRRAREVMGAALESPPAAVRDLDKALIALNHAPETGWATQDGGHEITCLADAQTWLALDPNLADPGKEAR